MRLNQNYPGYAHLIELIKERILSKELVDGGRIPSVRDLAAEMEVNPLTITRAYDRLQLAGIIRTQRGVGYFVSDGGYELVRRERLQKFYDERLKALKREMHLLGIDTRTVIDYLSENTEE